MMRSMLLPRSRTAAKIALMMLRSIGTTVIERSGRSTRKRRSSFTLPSSSSRSAARTIVSQPQMTIRQSSAFHAERKYASCDAQQPKATSLITSSIVNTTLKISSRLPMSVAVAAGSRGTSIAITRALAPIVSRMTALNPRVFASRQHIRRTKFVGSLCPLLERLHRVFTDVLVVHRPFSASHPEPRRPSAPPPLPPAASGFAARTKLPARPWRSRAGPPPVLRRRRRSPPSPSPSPSPPLPPPPSAAAASLAILSCAAAADSRDARQTEPRAPPPSAAAAAAALCRFVSRLRRARSAAIARMSSVVELRSPPPPPPPPSSAPSPPSNVTPAFGETRAEGVAVPGPTSGSMSNCGDASAPSAAAAAARSLRSSDGGGECRSAVGSSRGLRSPAAAAPGSTAGGAAAPAAPVPPPSAPPRLRGRLRWCRRSPSRGGDSARAGRRSASSQRCRRACVAARRRPAAVTRRRAWPPRRAASSRRCCRGCVAARRRLRRW